MTPETKLPNVGGLVAYPSRVAAYMPLVKGRCPACGLASLFLAVGNHVMCASLQCPDPGAAENVLGGPFE